MNFILTLSAGILLLLAAFQAKLGNSPAKGLVQFDPPEIYNVWWAETEKCSGLNAPMNKAVSSWWVTPHNEMLSTGDSPYDDGMFISVTRNVIVRLSFQSNENLIKHEMLHSILTWHGIENSEHPTKYFVDRCNLMPH